MYARISRRMWVGSFIALIGVFGTFLVNAAESPTVRTNFTARAQESGKVLFTGYSTTSIEGESIQRKVVYFDTGDKEVQSEQALFDKSRLRVSTLALSNSVVGYQASMESHGDQLSVHYRQNPAQSLKDRNLTWGKNDFHPIVFDDLILRNFITLRQAHPVDFSLLIPQMGSSVGMRLSNEGERLLDGETVAVFQLRPTSGLLRLIFPRTEYSYSLGPKPELREYIGPSPMPPGSRTMVSIRYSPSAPDAP